MSSGSPHQLDDGAQDKVRADFRSAFATRHRQDWVDVLAGADTCVTPVLSVDELVDDEQFEARHAIVEAVPDPDRCGGTARRPVPPGRPAAGRHGGRRRSRSVAGDPAGTDTDRLLGGPASRRERSPGCGTRGWWHERHRRADIEGLIGVEQYEEEGEFPVEQGYVWTTCSSVENANPLFWDEAVADEVTGGPIAPPTMVSVWFRPHHWAPGRTTQALPLQIHFDLKEGLGLPEAVMSDNTIVFHEPVRPGDRLVTRQILRSVSEPKTTRLGTGRFWVIDVEYTNQRGELVAVESYTGFGYRRNPLTADRGGRRERHRHPPPARRRLGRATSCPSCPTRSRPRPWCSARWPSRDWRPMHHDKDFAVNRNGTQDIFLNTPNLAAWFERFITDWTGPYGRLQRMTFRMLGSIFPGDTMVFHGLVTEIGVDDTGCGWAAIDISVSVDDDPKTTCGRGWPCRIEDDNPWERKGAGGTVTRRASRNPDRRRARPEQET